MVRQPLSVDLQVRIFFRDQWLCHWCRRPTIFAPAMKYLDRYVRDNGYARPISYFDSQWRRDAAPLLDELAAVIDHRIAHVRGGTSVEDNLVTACNKCNLRKTDKLAENFEAKESFQHTRGRYGEPENWDGFVSLFIIYSETYASQLTVNEKKWLNAIRNFLSVGSAGS